MSKREPHKNEGCTGASAADGKFVDSSRPEAVHARFLTHCPTLRPLSLPAALGTLQWKVVHAATFSVFLLFGRQHGFHLRVVRTGSTCSTSHFLPSQEPRSIHCEIAEDSFGVIGLSEIDLELWFAA